MKRHHFTTLCAIALVLAAIWVVLWTLKQPDADEPSPEAVAALKKRQAQRFKESKRARMAARASRPVSQLSPFKEQLLKQFPDLRPKPVIPNEENPIYLLNALANELLDDSQSFREELHEAMGKGERWNSGEVDAVLKRYAHILERLDEIATMQMGSSTFEGDDIINHQDAMMLFLDLISLRSMNLALYGSNEGLGESLMSGIRLSRLIQNSEGATVIHGLMAKAHMGSPEVEGLNQEIYDYIIGLGVHDSGLYGIMGLPDWGAALNRQATSGSPDLLIDQVQSMWDNQLAQDRLESDPRWGEERVAQAYSAELNRIISTLRTTDLADFWKQDMPAVPTTGLTPEQHRLVTQNVKETYESLKGIMHHAAYQSFEAAARELRMMERAGHAMHAVNMSKLPLNPITQTPYLYDPETRILSSPTLHHGEALSFQLHLPDQGSLNHVGTHFMPDK